MTALMIQGTTSDAGKSALVTGLCRILAQQGYRVAPFKPQNMALNSAVTVDGGEIGRAQALQAQACGIKPHTDMNPVLLKPNSDTGSQIIVQGKAIGNMDARSYHDYKAHVKTAVLESYRRLQQQYDIILIEGAGSPAEINLRDNDIANMGFAEAIDCPVLLIADIERGGVFAHLAGTLALLKQSERRRVAGLVINRFRGDPSLLDSGIDWLENNYNKPVLGVLPYLKDLFLDAEDSLNLRTSQNKPTIQKIRVVIPKLPRLSNHTDFDALFLHPHIDVQIVERHSELLPADLIILPGSKSVRADLQWLKDNNWVPFIFRHLRYAGKLIGICGGFQMLGDHIHDPHGIEGAAGSSKGLCLLNMETKITHEKQLNNLSGRLSFSPKVPIDGYEIHAGVSFGDALKRPAIILNNRAEGAISEDNQILGTYFHGLFDNHQACEALLKWAGLENSNETSIMSLPQRKELEINRMAECILNNVDLSLVYTALSLKTHTNIHKHNSLADQVIL